MELFNSTYYFAIIINNSIGKGAWSVMGRYLNPGNAGFQSIRKSLYIDKTGLISFINSTLGTMDKLTCISRPRRFGKSFAAKMLCAYYDKSCDSGELFYDLEVAKCLTYAKYLNKYNVLYLFGYYLVYFYY